MYCYRRLLQINWTQKLTNSTIRRRLNIKKDFIQPVMRRKLGLFGLVCRMENNRKIKDVMMGAMKGAGRQGRPCREWMDDIRDWCRTDVHRLSLQAQTDMKTIIKMHWTPMGQCPWIMMMTLRGT